ncbi:MAG: hypothetical protein WEB58_11190 [Planctomycetaceae bacterium]
MHRIIIAAVTAIVLGGLSYGDKGESTNKPAKVTIHVRCYEEQPGGAQRKWMSAVTNLKRNRGANG